MISITHNLAISLPPKPNPNPNISLLSLCNHLQEAKQVHAVLIKSSQISDPYSAARLAEFYAVSDHGSLHLAQLLVNSFHDPNTFAWNALIRGHLKNRNHQTAIKVYSQMLQKSVSPDQYTFTLNLKACAQLRDLGILRQICSHIVKHGLEKSGFVVNKLIHVYSVCGSVLDARKVFDRCPDRDVVTWNSMLQGYAENGDEMSLHKLFDEMPERDVVSWNTLLAYYVEVGEFKAAVELFRRMEKDGEKMDSVTLISVLTAAAHMGTLGIGQWVHSCILRSNIDVDENLGSALVNMYAKCGCMEGAINAFSMTKRKTVDVWNALISGLAVNGQSAEAVKCLSKMEASNVKPDAITFSALLNACSHGGLVEDGVRLFNKMRTHYRIIPDIVHYGCLVDLLSRAGLFSKVKEVMDSMAMEPDTVMWKAVLSACRVHKNLNIAEKAGHKLLELAPNDHTTCVLLSNVYAAAGKRSEAYNLRKIMRSEKMIKQPGCSSIEVDGVIHEFLAGDLNHCRKDEIYRMLEEMLERLAGYGYKPDKEQVLLDVDEEDVKCVSLAHHSEKLAVAFGLISTTKGTVIRVVKNLRICGDCHAAFKLIAVIYNRNIIVRDSNRFHHFSKGSCSCGDYW
ncbi:hypothetical protein V2J09_003643 [Rumex salicifolius]